MICIFSLRRKSYLTRPIAGVVKTHGGTDIAAPEGTPILAAADGTVVAATYNAGGYGFYVKIMHNATYSTLYGHCSALLVSAGRTVKQGQVSRFNRIFNRSASSF